MLIDSIKDDIFYVGKGTGNRIFSHLNDALTNPQKTDKLERIRKIHSKGLEVKHTILRHGLTTKEAFEIEASVIDLLGIEGLTNIVLGKDSQMRGKMLAILLPNMLLKKLRSMNLRC